jgi:hypothetical protein
MGLGILPIFKPNVAAAVFEPDGKILAANCEALAELADLIGVSPLSAYCDMREIPEGYEGEPSDLDIVMGRFDDWFNPSDAIHSFSQLIVFIQSGDSRAHCLADPQYVVEELLCLVECLKKAEMANAKFHLELV